MNFASAKRRTANRFAAEDHTVNEDDERQQAEEALAAGGARSEQDDTYAEIMSAILATARRAEIERHNERNSANNHHHHHLLVDPSPGPHPDVDVEDRSPPPEAAPTNRTLVDAKFNRLLTEVTEIRDQIGGRLETINRRLTQTSQLFLAHQDYGQRSTKAGDLLLVGVPYRSGEDLRECFVRLARRLGFAESEIPMVHLKRLAGPAPLSGGTGTGPSSSSAKRTMGHHPTNRPQPTQYSPAVLDNLPQRMAAAVMPTPSPPTTASGPVHVQFVFRNARNEFYRRYLDGGASKTLCLRDIGYEGAGRLFVNEDLTRCNVSLKAEAMRLKRDGKIKSVFTVNGQIYVKRTVDHRPELVTSSVDLLLLDDTKMKANKDCYPRVLEHIISTQSPQVLCRDYKEILGTLDVFSTDPDESVRLYLACWLHKYCASWFDRDQDQQSIFSKAFPEKILQIIVRYLTDEPNVRAATFESLTFLIEKGYLDRATTIKLNIVEELVSKPINESFMDMCTNYIHLMVKIAPLVGSAKTQELLYSRFVKMCTCKINFVRKECATAFPVMCEVLGNEVFEKNLLHIFMKLCEDEIWTVRKACAEVMPFIALLCTLEKRRKVLVPAYKKFMFDSSQWVIKAALKNLGRFLATFAQLQILGLAYNNSLELSITNAADEAFQELMANSRQLTYGSSQPAPSVLLKNFECYEKRFKESIQRHALLSLVKSDDEPWKSPRTEDRINIEAYLSSVVFVEQHPSQRQSTGSTSDDGGGISKLADFYYVRHKSLSSSSSIASTSPTPSPLFRANQTYDEKNPLNRFLRYCSPLKNNFENAFSNPSGGDGGEQGGGSDAFDNHGHWDSEDDNFGTKLPDLSLGDGGGGGSGADGYGGGLLGDGAAGTSGVIFDGDNPKHVAEAAAAGSGGLDFIMESSEEDENTIDEYFNSHQFWYISPGLALDLEFIDSDGGDGNGGKDASNNNQPAGGGDQADDGDDKKTTEAVTVLEDDSRNNNLLLQGSSVPATASSSHSAGTPVPSGNESSASSAMAVEDSENQNDSDSSYGSINNNESDNKLIYMYEDLLPPSQAASGASAVAAGTTGGSSGGAVITATSASASSTSTTGGGAAAAATTTVERIRAAEQLRTQIRWENEEVEWNLLEDFLHMKNVNKELCLDCAYNFPAVVLTFGEKFWPILSRYFFDLCADVQQPVRRTMAASISKVALIIGREQATRDLVSLYTEFLLDSDDIKFEVVRTLAEFLKVIDSCEHETLMNHLGMCLQPPLQMMNWRFRELAGQQIAELARMHTKIRKENCLLFLTGLSLRLMLDKYDSVRKAGIDAFVECSHEFQQNDKVFEFFNKHFAFYNEWRRRQTYVIAAGKMLETDGVEVKLFRKHVFNNVLKLASDVVPNVRIQVAKCLKEIIVPHANFADDPLVESAMEKLRHDVDCDVRGHIDGYQSMEEEMAAAAAATDDGGGGSSSSRASATSSAGTAEAGGGIISSAGGETEHTSPSSSCFSMPVSSPLSYAEVTSGYLGSPISSLLLDDGLGSLLTKLKHDKGSESEQQQHHDERRMGGGDPEEVELTSSGHHHHYHHLHHRQQQQQQADEEDECGEEAIEQPTSSMSTDDDAAYCSEMESSTAASTPSATLPTRATTTTSIPLEQQQGHGDTTTDDTETPVHETEQNRSNNNQVGPATGGNALEATPPMLVNGENTVAPSTDSTDRQVTASTVPSSIPTSTTTTVPRVRDYFRRRSKGKK
ncbi:uncharacterized protein LOC128266866 [Anopheles cruzii]|uniref:uncharacterized protein LOC128266866 n=1 Tax=Anopheles cruzii TaxID=68878 RepID=UPI0022EC998F|nr:uncharacterized protein LOC128266866 [Anopheles cruzii]